MTRRSYFDVLTAAVADLTTHGFDSSERLEYWEKQLRESAEASMASTHQMQEMLRSGLTMIYRRMVESEGALKHHPGVSRFTLQKIAPRLRNELDRRIMASAQLIRLNRRQTIEKTLQRFAGWAASIPKGGTKATDKVKTKTDIAKSLKSVPFEERRVLIDQGHKLTASINEIIASDGGAIAIRWRSHWRQSGYNYRPDHKERDGNIYLIRGSWASKAGLVKRGPAGYYDEVTAVAEEPFCRCFAVYLYALRDLPEDMLTPKGKAELERVRAQIAGMT